MIVSMLEGVYSGDYFKRDNIFNRQGKILNLKERYDPNFVKFTDRNK